MVNVTVTVTVAVAVTVTATGAGVGGHAGKHSVALSKQLQLHRLEGHGQ
jgi:hypothetical protein